jgi:hypothetical protein
VVTRIAIAPARMTRSGMPLAHRCCMTCLDST